MPISFVLSSTFILNIVIIMIIDTINDIKEKLEIINVAISK